MSRAYQEFLRNAPRPSWRILQEIKRLPGREFTGGDNTILGGGENEVYYCWLMPRGPMGKVFTVCVKKKMEAYQVVHIPLVTDGDAADFYRRVTGKSLSGVKDGMSRTYEESLRKPKTRK